MPNPILPFKSRARLQHVLIMDITSPFFNWEGRVTGDLIEGHYVSVICSVHNIDFPPLTFNTSQLKEV